jgi:hypothetical protein
VTASIQARSEPAPALFQSCGVFEEGNAIHSNSLLHCKAADDIMEESFESSVEVDVDAEPEESAVKADGETAPPEEAAPSFSKVGSSSSTNGKQLDYDKMDIPVFGWFRQLKFALHKNHFLILRRPFLLMVMVSLVPSPCVVIGPIPRRCQVDDVFLEAVSIKVSLGNVS